MIRSDYRFQIQERMQAHTHLKYLCQQIVFRGHFNTIQLLTLWIDRIIIIINNNLLIYINNNINNISHNYYYYIIRMIE